ncbi:uncharacterized protein LOC133890234 [Phragmites australis]|uniref:uncharacterized protein LOC133890234 n=1 Tax=Phragmites australis TaxID=29695 RepID=UPI002D7935EF|nr:uncharacterized protein LOC133890234 [Phragmites australis]
MDRFIIKELQVPFDNQILDQDPALDINVANDPNDGETEIENIVEEVLVGSTNVQVVNNGDNIDDTSSPAANVGTSFQPGIFDPRYWDALDPKQVDILAKKGPKRDLSIQKCPKDRFSRRMIGGSSHWNLFDDSCEIAISP